MTVVEDFDVLFNESLVSWHFEKATLVVRIDTVVADKAVQVKPSFLPDGVSVNPPSDGRVVIRPRGKTRRANQQEQERHPPGSSTWVLHLFS